MVAITTTSIVRLKELPHPNSPSNKIKEKAKVKEKQMNRIGYRSRSGRLVQPTVGFDEKNNFAAHHSVPTMMLNSET